MRVPNYQISGVDLFTHRTEALSAEERAQLTGMLAQLPHPDAATFEGMDGLFCALIARQQPIRASACLSVVLGGHRDDRVRLEERIDTATMMQLIVSHWDHVAANLKHKSVHLPQLAAVTPGEVPGQAWAQGFMRGVRMHSVGWSELFGDEAEGDLLVIALVAGELGANWRQAPLDGAAQDGIVNSLAVGAARSYRYFKGNHR